MVVVQIRPDTLRQRGELTTAVIKPNSLLVFIDIVNFTMKINSMKICSFYPYNVRVCRAYYAHQDEDSFYPPNDPIDLCAGKPAIPILHFCDGRVHAQESPILVVGFSGCPKIVRKSQTIGKSKSVQEISMSGCQKYS